MSIRVQPIERRMDIEKFKSLKHRGGHVGGIYATTVKRTEFLVINHMGCSPKIMSKDGRSERDYKGFIQFFINGTYYFDQFDGRGISNKLAKFPLKKDDLEIFDTDQVYALPGQTLVFGFTFDGDDHLEDDEYIDIGILITKYDGTDAVLASALISSDNLVNKDTIHELKVEMMKNMNGQESDKIMQDAKASLEQEKDGN